MQVKEILVEARRNKVILVDFQPAYNTNMQPGDGAIERGNTWYSTALSNACEHINKRNADVLAFFNGMDVGIYDTDDDVYRHYLEHGLNPNANIQFREKGYAFLRSWMDQHISPNTIIKVLRQMMRDGYNNSREYEPEQLQKIVGKEWNDYMYDDMIYIPDVAIAELKSLSGALIGGGGRDECLRELEILMSAFNIRYKRVQDWMYG